MDDVISDFRSLATYRRCVDRIVEQWPLFLERRADRLRRGDEKEKTAEGVLEDLFTDVLDWSVGDLAYQDGHADIVLSKNLAKFLVVEVKRPGTLWPGRAALDRALAQVRRYADEQKITKLAASDGRLIYAADIEHGVLKELVMVDLDRPDAPLCLWWLSVHGVYRACEEPVAWPTMNTPLPAEPPHDDTILHPKYGLPAECFAYVGDANDPHTWKLPYRMMDGAPDEKRLPKAIQALLSNYRGAKVGGIPEAAIPSVLQVLAKSAVAEGRMPPQTANPAPVYISLAQVLQQQGLKWA